MKAKISNFFLKKKSLRHTDEGKNSDKTSLRTGDFSE
jgi:hypothetical protein